MTMISPDSPANSPAEQNPQPTKSPAGQAPAPTPVASHVTSANPVQTNALSAVLPTATIEISLFAPTINGAALTACFTRWQELPMAKDAHGYWRILVDLPDGDYSYRFRVQTKSWFYEKDQWVTVTDPKATRVDERTGNGILRVRNGKVSCDEYQWQHDAKPLPANNELIIYELHVADFSGGEADVWQRGKFKDVIDKLDYLADLGINCLELLPVKEFPGNYAWGYTPQYLFAPESAYGPPEDLKALVDAAHARGMRVIFDGVYNHAHTDTPLASIDHDYWFHHNPKDRNMSWGPQYNYDHTDPALNIMPAREFIKENLQYWVSQYHIDGIRYDAAAQIESYEVMRMMADTARGAAGIKPFINIAEYLPDKPDLVGFPDSGKPMDACWHDSFFWTVADQTIAHGNLDLERVKCVLQPRLQGFSDCTQIVNYASNHDHLRLMPHMAKSLVFDEHAFRRAKLAATLVMTAVGIPMIWMGEEFGDYHPKNTDPEKIDWTLLANENNKNLHAHYKRIIQLRRENKALHNTDLDYLFEHKDDGILAYLRQHNENDTSRKIVVIANLRDRDYSTYTVPFLPEDGEWTDWFTGQKVEIQDKKWTGPLHPWQAVVLVKG
ncbi:MAG: alpha-amylase family glycosyl hydrolase [Phycisphaerae bacterium]